MSRQQYVFMESCVAHVDSEDNFGSQFSPYTKLKSSGLEPLHWFYHMKERQIHVGKWMQTQATHTITGSLEKCMWQPLELLTFCSLKRNCKLCFLFLILSFTVREPVSFLPLDNNKDCWVPCGGRFVVQHLSAHEVCGQHWSILPHAKAGSQEAEGNFWNSEIRYQLLDMYKLFSMQQFCQSSMAEYLSSEIHNQSKDQNYTSILL